MVYLSPFDQFPGLAKYVLVVYCIALSDLAMSDLSGCASPILHPFIGGLTHDLRKEDNRGCTFFI